MKNQEIIQLLENKAKTLDDGKKLSMSFVVDFCSTLGIDESNQTKIINALEDKGIVETSKGYQSMTAAQLKIHRYINEQMLVDLQKVRKSSIELTEEECSSLVTDDVSGNVCVLNKKGDLIKPSCNNTNVTQARKVRELKAMQDQISK